MPLKVFLSGAIEGVEDYGEVVSEIILKIAKSLNCISLPTIVEKRNRGFCTWGVCQYFKETTNYLR